MIISKTPLRISLLGGNTDFPAYYKKYGGAVLTTTIDKYVYCIVKGRFDNDIWINYSKKEIVKDVNKIKHGIVRETLKYLKYTGGIEITFLSDIPSEGSGLGSSSAVTIGLLNALHAFRGEAPSKAQLAAEAIEIELGKMKKKIGVQDQYAIAFGGLNLITFDKKETIVKRLIFNLKDPLMLFYTGKTRKAETILSKMRLSKRILDRNKILAQQGATDLSENGMFIGTLMDEYWNLKRKLNKHVTNRYIDNLYNKAMKLGATGGKVVGAGGGGFLLFSVPKSKKSKLRKCLGLREFAFDFSYRGSTIIYESDE